MSHRVPQGHSSNPVLDRLERLVAEVGDLQSKLILLVGNGSKTQLLRQLAQRLNVAPRNVGATLGNRLAATTAAERGFLTNELLREVTDSARGVEPLLLDNLDSTIRPASKRPDLKPVFSFNSDGIFAGVSGGNATTAGGIGRLSRWEDAWRRILADGYE